MITQERTDTLRRAPVAPASGEVLDVISPFDGRVLATISARRRVLQRIGDAIADQAHALAVLGVRDSGTEISMAIKAEPMSAATTFRYYDKLCDKQYGEVAPTGTGGLCMVLHAPVGVVDAIVRSYFPLMIGA